MGVLTAQALPPDVAATLLRNAYRGCGVGTRFHAAPFQRTITVLAGLNLVESVQPTAQALRAETAATPLRVAPVPGLGLGPRFHEVPFQCMIRAFQSGSSSSPGGEVWPTAHTLPEEVAATAYSRPSASCRTTAPGRP